MISISLNGEPREVPANLTLVALLDWLKLPQDRVAVEHNRKIVPRDGWAGIAVEDGDHLEIVQFVGGG